ncbi:hypothetical protein CDCA_CDCA04G1371 [Cyanidium caldarium]|uniref:Aminoacyl-transfer RNA synthetases class-II family profile domain-containing protein n=1 Tax=Cyanidium caldarium TaxID=2771 RepID=A0AAV9ITF2_CYACA|nr:hypothetical protein CDCA_CDCA04G1371 [Cyanidium caldarium]
MSTHGEWNGTKIVSHTFASCCGTRRALRGAFIATAVGHGAARATTAAAASGQRLSRKRDFYFIPSGWRPPTRAARWRWGVCVRTASMTTARPTASTNAAANDAPAGGAEPATVLATSLRTHGCGTLRPMHIGQQVSVCGWAHAIRDRGGVSFLLLRDRYGIVQVTFRDDAPEDARHELKQVRKEFVVWASGRVAARDAAAINAAMPTGEIEILAAQVRICSRARPLPLAFDDLFAQGAHDTTVSEETRLRYRYLDLRRPLLHDALIARHQAAMRVRQTLDALQFVEVETPVLTRATPEGARDYLVPSRVHRGSWYALPQSPQLYKQLLMIGGVDRYFQITRCFRDEDLRQDRQPEFTQIDMEMSFVGAADVMPVVEAVARALFRGASASVERAATGAACGARTAFPVLTYAECLERFGVDAPDLRFGMELQTVMPSSSSTSAAEDRRALQALPPLAQADYVRALVVEGAADGVSRKKIDEYIAAVKTYGLGGLLWGKVTGDGEQRRGIGAGPLSKLAPEAAARLLARLGAPPGSLVLIGAGEARAVQTGLGRLRVRIAGEHGLLDRERLCFCWVVGFPLFEWDAEQRRLQAVHHPFTAPRAEDYERLMQAVEADVHSLTTLVSDAYDLVCNGTEIGGGSIRIHNAEMQRRVLRLLGLDERQQRQQFGFLLDALDCGAPPHGGFAFGFDRCVMMMQQADSIRDVIAFPKSTSATDLMCGAPGPADPRQVEELGLQVKDECE